MPGVMAAFYATELALTVVTCLLLFYFGRFLPKDFAKLGRFLSCLGMLLKLFPKLIVLLHYVILILIVVLAAQVGNKNCATA